MYSILLPIICTIIFSDLNYIVSLFSILIILCVPFLSASNISPFFHSYGLCWDNLSVFLVILSIWITLLMCISMNNAPSLNNLFLCFTSLNTILVLSFLSSSLLGFYIFFELSLIPTLIIILGWGAQPERIRAGSYLMIYTLVGSLPLLGAIIYMDFHCGSVKMFSPLIDIFFFSSFDYSLFCILWILAFLIKLPIYGVHLWLPKAHVEAPVAGSMVLAGVLLKLGAYGLVRSLRFLSLDLSFWSDTLFIWAIFSMCLVGIMCFRQCDLKSLVAYSSVAHMSLILASCFSCDIIGINGVMGMLISHGLCSSGLFFGVQCLYENSGSRNIFLNRGILCISPLFSFFWLLLCVGNASAPPSLNLLSEFFLVSGILNFGGSLSAVFCILSVFLGGLFSIYLYVLICHGKWNSSNNYWSLHSMRNYMVLFLHFFPLYGLLFLSNYIFF
uniref:NADH-ubiquinone oxidoreductase chain 4 n=1 Tax=Discocelis tigrina TaxID=52060 RepID=A0A2R3SK46_9PLAT|nr:NADH dehydrogenase subunit 4 [Discocelis tigrina]